MRLARSRAAGIAIAAGLLAAVAVACGSNSDSSGPDPAGTVSDEEYLAEYCGGLAQYRNAVIGSTTREAIVKATAAWADRLDAITPPRDLVAFTRLFVAYLRDGAKEPSLLRRDPPTPPEKARERLASKEANVRDCKPGAFARRDSAAAGD